MEDIGSLVFYIILGLIAVLGSLQGKGKKKYGMPGQPQRKPGTTVTPDRGHRPAGVPSDAGLPKPTPVRQMQPARATHYEPPRSTLETQAGRESIAGQMAAMFANEGVSALSERSLIDNDSNDVSSDEIGSLTPGHEREDHIFGPGGEEFDLRRAIIYSMILERREYPY